MKKELKLLGKYVGMSVLITTFVVLLFYGVLDKISAYQEMSKLLIPEDLGKPEMIEHLKFFEDHILEAAEDTGKHMKEQGYEDYPALGAHIQAIILTTRLYYGLYELSLAIPLGILLGILYYFVKKEFKKPIHFIFVFALIFVLMTTVISMGICIKDSWLNGVPELDWEIIGETMRDTWLLYAIICVIVYVVMYIVSKKKTDLLNKEINNK